MTGLRNSRYITPKEGEEGEGGAGEEVDGIEELLPLLLLSPLTPCRVTVVVTTALPRDADVVFASLPPSPVLSCSSAV